LETGSRLWPSQRLRSDARRVSDGNPTSRQAPHLMPDRQPRDKQLLALTSKRL